MATSYICEHTAEFSLVPALKAILHREYDLITPVFPWLNREGGNLSKSLHRDDSFKLLAMFARRPKLDYADSRSLCLTINGELEEFAVLAEENGIPVIAGCPIASDFWELGRAEAFIWLRLGRQTFDQYLISISDLSQGYSSSLLDESGLLRLVRESASVQSVLGFRDFLHESRQTFSTGFFGAQYKPVYFLMKSTGNTL